MNRETITDTLSWSKIWHKTVASKITSDPMEVDSSARRGKKRQEVDRTEDDDKDEDDEVAQNMCCNLSTRERF